MPAWRRLTSRVYCVEQQRGSALAHLEEWLADRRERWVHERSRGGVVETEERHVFWHTNPRLLSGDENTRRHVVAGREDGCGPIREREELLSAGGAARHHEVTLSDQVRIKRDSRLLKSVTIAPIAILGAFVADASFDVANAAMAELHEMLHGGIGAGAVIRAHPGCRPSWDRLVVKHYDG